MSTLSATNLKNASSTSNNIVLGTDGSTTITTLTGTTITGTSVRGVVTSGTSVASTSGTSIDFTSIPSWVKRVTVMFNGVSTSGTSALLIQLGSGSVTTTGYVSQACLTAGSNAHTTSTAGLLALQAAVATDVYYGNVNIATLGANLWSSNGLLATSTSGRIHTSAGGTSTALGGALDRVRITTVNGTDTFDAGNINILYEG